MCDLAIYYILNQYRYLEIYFLQHYDDIDHPDLCTLPILYVYEHDLQ